MPPTSKSPGSAILVYSFCIIPLIRLSNAILGSVHFLTSSNTSECHPVLLERCCKSYSFFLVRTKRIRLYISLGKGSSQSLPVFRPIWKLASSKADQRNTQCYTQHLTSISKNSCNSSSLNTSNKHCDYFCFFPYLFSHSKRENETFFSDVFLSGKMTYLNYLVYSTTNILLDCIWKSNFQISWEVHGHVLTVGLHVCCVKMTTSKNTLKYYEVF